VKFLKQYFYNLLLGADQWINTILLGDPDESLSGRTGRAMASGKPKWFVPAFARLVDWLLFSLVEERNHVKNSIEPEERPLEKELWSWIKK
jgi:hypothetical protein